MDKGCLPFVIGFVVLVIIYSVLSKGESYGFEALIKIVVFVLSMVGIWQVILYFNDNKRD
jgi:hypothetical protein